MNRNISDKDKKDWENFLSQDESLPNKDLSISKDKKITSKLCDLHGYSLDEANKKINDLTIEQKTVKLELKIVNLDLAKSSNFDKYVFFQIFRVLT